MIILRFIKLLRISDFCLGMIRSIVPRITYDDGFALKVFLLDLVEDLFGNLLLFRRIDEDCASVLSAN